MKSLSLLTLLGSTRLAATQARQADCKEVNFTVSGTAENRNITGFSSTFSNITALKDAIAANDYPKIPVSGAQNLAGWYCKPQTQNANSDKLQLFFNSITSNREMWTAQGGTGLNDPPYKPYKPQIYSWVAYANNLGYPTLAIDLLGQGLSSHPDPVFVVQYFYEAALYHDLVKQLKGGTTGEISKPYDKIYLVGNSYGSELGNYMAQQYPNDFDAIVLTGWSTAVETDLPGILLLKPKPAATVDKAKFGSLNSGYLATPHEQSRTNSFFGSHKYVNFTNEQAELWFQRQDVVSIGQLYSIYTITAPAPAYTGRVLVLDGEEDQAFCGNGSSALTPDTQCAPLLPKAASYFPNAQANYYSVPASGHALILHETAQETLSVAHEFFGGARFKSA